MKYIGTANCFHYLEVFLIERYKSIEECANGTVGIILFYEVFFTVGGFIIEGSTVHTYVHLSKILTCAP